MVSDIKGYNTKIGIVVNGFFSIVFLAMASIWNQIDINIFYKVTGFIAILTSIAVLWITHFNKVKQEQKRIKKTRKLR